MEKVQIVTDSNAYLSPEVLEKYDITVIPHQIKVGKKVCTEDENFTADNLFQEMDRSYNIGVEHLPVVNAADINEILDAYQTVSNQAEEVMSIHMSSQLSPMWGNVHHAGGLLKGRATIRAIDSLSTSFGLGLLVEMAAEAAEQGASLSEIARIINGAVPHLYFTVFSESLSYLERSTNLSASQSLLGTMLGIKAMLMMEDGDLVPLEKVQTREDVVEKLYEFVVEFASVERVGIMQDNYDETCDQLVERLNEALPNVSIDRVPYPPSLATYLGPNIIGIVVYEGTY